MVRKYPAFNNYSETNRHAYKQTISNFSRKVDDKTTRNVISQHLLHNKHALRQTQHPTLCFTICQFVIDIVASFKYLNHTWTTIFKDHFSTLASRDNAPIHNVNFNHYHIRKGPKVLCLKHSLEWGYFSHKLT